ncbi:tryptophan synthase subunit beta [Salinisphaera sp. USBA-960]|uniref:tryptophan synthase subunit beta n=1 Tax=Salinisphaera orenii TaxID=856731 RepID=UPI000DBE6472|nr:tryptophan synthase subunit beta [Salifodinibacter halophilus]NNC26105.1 tryptophan synthase subunit beta [Salifodinibacter halophilus]
MATSDSQAGNNPAAATPLESLPDARGHFGPYGGRFVAETLMAPLYELEAAYASAMNDPDFARDLARDLSDFVGRPTPLYHAAALSAEAGGAQIWLKREDLAHTGAHKINNTVGQALLAQRMGKTRIVAETGAGQHGIATASVAARLGLECVIYMGSEDMRRQATNVYRMRLVGAEVRSVNAGSKTLKDAMNEALRDWVTNVDDTFYIIGTVAGPHPYPQMVRDFQSVIGREAREQVANAQFGGLPDALVACVGGGSNALGLFYPFLDDAVACYGVEAGGKGVASGQHAAPLAEGQSGVLHGNRTYVMQDENGQVLGTHSVSAGLDYPGVGPEHAWLKDKGFVHYVSIEDAEALDALHATCRREGILPALETAHAIAYARELAASMRPDQTILVNCSGRGDKDMASVAEAEGTSL